MNDAVYQRFNEACIRRLLSYVENIVIKKRLENSFASKLAEDPSDDNYAFKIGYAERFAPSETLAARSIYNYSKYPSKAFSPTHVTDVYLSGVSYLNQYHDSNEISKEIYREIINDLTDLEKIMYDIEI